MQLMTRLLSCSARICWQSASRLLTFCRLELRVKYNYQNIIISRSTILQYMFWKQYMFYILYFIYKVTKNNFLFSFSNVLFLSFTLPRLRSDFLAFAFLLSIALLLPHACSLVLASISYFRTNLFFLCNALHYLTIRKLTVKFNCKKSWKCFLIVKLQFRTLLVIFSLIEYVEYRENKDILL